MNTLLIILLTWTDIFEGIGKFFQWTFVGIRGMGQIPNVLISSLVIFGIGYWTWRLARYRKSAARNGTAE